jgi:hypothetical protein
MTNSLEALFCHVDDFCQIFEPKWHSLLLGNGLQQRQRQRSLCMSEIMTILITFHQSHYRNFKHFYQDHVCKYLHQEFPKLPSYTRFVEFMGSAMMPLCIYLKHCFGSCTGISFMDSTCLHVCHNRRISQHRVFKGLAARGKTSVDWFFGFKLHLVVNEYGQLLNIQITPGNVDDRKPVIDLLKSMSGKVFADRGYVSKSLAEELFKNFGIQFFPKPRRNMKNHLMGLHDKLLSRKRSIIETIIDQLKNISQIEHSRHRSPINAMVNIICGLIAYCHQPKKPSLLIDWALPFPA